MATLGALTVFYLLAPTLVIVPMSFTEARICELQPRIQPQWYQRMLTDRQWSNGIINSLLVALLTAALATVLGTPPRSVSAAGGSRTGARERPRALADRACRGHRDRHVRAVRAVEAGRVGDGARAGPHGTGAAVRRRQRQHVAPDDGPQPGAGRGESRRRPAPSFFHITLPIILPGVVAGAIFSFITSMIVVAIFMTSARFHAAGRDVGAGPPGRRSDRRYRRHSS